MKLARLDEALRLAELRGTLLRTLDRLDEHLHVTIDSAIQDDAMLEAVRPVVRQVLMRRIHSLELDLISMGLTID